MTDSTYSLACALLRPKRTGGRQLSITDSPTETTDAAFVSKHSTPTHQMLISHCHEIQTTASNTLQVRQQLGPFDTACTTWQSTSLFAPPPPALAQQTGGLGLGPLMVLRVQSSKPPNR